VSESRHRPTLHFTASQGWTNDPHGIVHAGGRYHMFFQYNPDDVQWNQACHWGQATSDDLLVWEQQEVALTPEAGEIGCWSGSAVIDTTGPVLAYTRIAHDDWGRGAVALARPTGDMSGWTRTPTEAVLDGPPPGLDIIAFRDPQIRARGEGWVAVMGAGLVGHGGCALQYGVSPDLTAWTFEGVLASRANADRDPVWSGKVWECPQFIELDGRWVLIVSVWEDDVLHNVVYAVGDYDGLTFVPASWGTFSHGPQLYATTTFCDREGHPYAMSWMREQGNKAPDGSPWCSAMSLPHRLALSGDRLVVSQHPELWEHLPVQVLSTDVSEGAPIDVAIPASGAWRVVLECAPSSSFSISANAGEFTWSVEADADTGSVQVLASDGRPLLMMPGEPGAGGTLDIVVDVDILELTWSAGEGVGAVRVDDAAGGRLAVQTRGGSASVRMQSARADT